MPRDFWIGLVGLCLAALYWHEADKIRISPLDGPVGASGLPKALAIALGVLALVLVARGLLQRFAASASAPAGPEDGRLRQHLRAAGMLGLGVAYLLVVPWLGYAVAIVALMLAVALYAGAPFGLRTVAVAVLGGVFFQLLFVEFLGIPLPKGALLGLIL